MIQERLHLLRNEAHKTQQDIADALNISRVAYSYYESGIRTPSLDTLSRLADYYGVSLDYIYGHSDQKDFIPVSTKDEALLLERFRSADDRGRYTILNIAWHEYLRYEKLQKKKALQRIEEKTRPKKNNNPFLNH